MTKQADTKIVRAAIHPGIGVARIGNSPDEYYIGPETVTPPKREVGFFRDKKGALKREGARFRVYGFNAAGEVVREISTAAGDEVEWTVHVANRKGDWYRFIAALDIPDAVDLQTILRNKSVRPAERDSLVIDPGPRSISGKSKRGDKKWRLDTGKFMGAKVDLGEILTDEAGRLIFLGGLGEAGSPKNLPLFDKSDPDSYNNADGWYDDTSDGPVSARVKVDGVEIEAESAWVIVAPPNYAPDIIGWRSMYDLQRAVFTTAGQLPLPDPVLFTRDILPQLRRMSELQWVNKGIAGMFGARRAARFRRSRPDRAACHGARRCRHRSVAGASANDLQQLPAGDPQRIRSGTLALDLYGDAFGCFCETSPRNNLALPSYQAALLRQWVNGAFVDDRATAAAIPSGRRGSSARRSARHARPGLDELLPRRRLPSGLRDDLADAPCDALFARRSGSAAGPRGRRSRYLRTPSSTSRSRWAWRVRSTPRAPAPSPATWRCPGTATPPPAARATIPITIPISPPSGRRASPTRCSTRRITR